MRRTRRTCIFGAWMPPQLEGTTRLCRFYGDLRGGPDSQYARRFEGYAGNVVVPASGACPNNLSPAYRLYNRGVEKGGAPNRRYTSDPSLYADMQSKGWAGEGVVFCVPPVPGNVSRP